MARAVEAADIVGKPTAGGGNRDKTNWGQNPDRIFCKKCNRWRHKAAACKTAPGTGKGAPAGGNKPRCARKEAEIPAEHVKEAATLQGGAAPSDSESDQGNQVDFC